MSGDSVVLLRALGDYTEGVVKKEWPMMLADQQREMFVASPELDNVRAAIMDLDPQGKADEAAFQQDTVRRYGQVVEVRASAACSTRSDGCPTSCASR